MRITKFKVPIYVDISPQKIHSLVKKYLYFHFSLFSSWQENKTNMQFSFLSVQESNVIKLYLKLIESNLNHPNVSNI